MVVPGLCIQVTSVRDRADREWPVWHSDHSATRLVYGTVDPTGLKSDRCAGIRGQKSWEELENSVVGSPIFHRWLDFLETGRRVSEGRTTEPAQDCPIE